VTSIDRLRHPWQPVKREHYLTVILLCYTWYVVFAWQIHFPLLRLVVTGDCWFLFVSGGGECGKSTIVKQMKWVPSLIVLSYYLLASAISFLGVLWPSLQLLRLHNKCGSGPKYTVTYTRYSTVIIASRYKSQTIGAFLSERLRRVFDWWEIGLRQWASYPIID